MSRLTPKTKKGLRERRHARIRAKISGTAERPRLAIFRSNTAIYAQLIDDTRSVTIASAHSRGTKGKPLTLQAAEVGKAIAEAARGKSISTVVFDRAGFSYGGRIKAFADAAREAGLVF